MDAAQSVSTADALLAVRALWAVGGALVIGAGLLWKVAVGVTALRKDFDVHADRIGRLEQSEKTHKDWSADKAAEIDRRIQEAHDHIDEHAASPGHPIAEVRREVMEKMVADVSLDVKALRESLSRQSSDIHAMREALTRLMTKVGA